MRRCKKGTECCVGAEERRRTAMHEAYEVSTGAGGTLIITLNIIMYVYMCREAENHAYHIISELSAQLLMEREECLTRLNDVRTCCSVRIISFVRLTSFVLSSLIYICMCGCTHVRNRS